MIYDYCYIRLLLHHSAGCSVEAQQRRENHQGSIWHFIIRTLAPQSAQDTGHHHRFVPNGMPLSNMIHWCCFFFFSHATAVGMSGSIDALRRQFPLGLHKPSGWTTRFSRFFVFQDAIQTSWLTFMVATAWCNFYITLTTCVFMFARVGLI